MINRALEAGMPFGWVAADETSDALKLSTAVEKVAYRDWL